MACQDSVEFLLPQQPAAVGTPQPITHVHETVTQNESVSFNMTPPPGHGQLFQCSFCHAYVFESQLQYHVQICADPNAQEPSGSDQQQCLGLDKPMPGSVAGHNPTLETLHEEVYSGWPPETDVCEPEVANEAERQGISQPQQWQSYRCQHSTQERDLAYQDLYELAGPNVVAESKIMRRGLPDTAEVQRSRGEKNMSNETHQQRPCSRHQKTKQPFNPRPRAALPAQPDAAVTPQNGPIEQQKKTSSAESVRRKVPTSELLYKDASDRRHRLQIAQEKLRMEADARGKLQILNGSRRYYWQMIERQVKAAFASVSNDESYLHKDKLGAFLIKFGCAPDRGDQADTRHDAELTEEASMHSALWQYLDPQNSGRSDILTTTIFFQVLMGAVDAEAKAAMDMRAKSDPAPVQGGPGQLNRTALTAITEEESPQKSPSMDAILQDSDTSHIMDMLARFEPLRLQKEFQTLYCHRLYYQYQQLHDKEKQQTEEAVSEVVMPNINAQSRSLARKVLDKEKETAETPLDTHVDVMMWRYKQTVAKKEQRRMAASEHKLKECTFEPKLRNSHLHADADIKTPNGTRREQMLYARGITQQERKDRLRDQVESARSSTEVKGCTFRPDISKSRRSYTRTQNDVNLPKGFLEAQSRLRSAREVKDEARRQEEDRMGRLRPRSQSSGLRPRSQSADQPLAASSGTLCTSKDAGQLAARPKTPTYFAKTGSRPLTPEKYTPRTPENSSMHPRSPEILNRTASGTKGVATPQRCSGQHLSGSQSARVRPHPQLGAAPVSRISSQSRKTAQVCSWAGAKTKTPSPPKGNTAPRVRLQRHAGTRIVTSAVVDNMDKRRMDHNQPLPDIPPVVLIAEVSVAPGSTPERMVVREGQSIAEVTNNFAMKHNLSDALTLRLHDGIIKAMVEASAA